MYDFTCEGESITDPKVVAEKFNEYFVNIGETLSKSIAVESTQFTSYLRESYVNSFSLYLTDACEIRAIVDKFDNKSSFGVDNIPVSVMKSVIDVIAEPISALVNCSFSTGVVPDPLKIAKVCPVHKGGPTNTFTNFRPISILPSFSKIFEKAANNRLESYVKSQHILSDSQYGFRENHSTFMALLDICDKVSKSFDRKEYCAGVFSTCRKRSIL